MSEKEEILQIMKDLSYNIRIFRDRVIKGSDKLRCNCHD